MLKSKLQTWLPVSWERRRWGFKGGLRLEGEGELLEESRLGVPERSRSWFRPGVVRALFAEFCAVETVFQNLMQRSAVPPPLARRPRWWGLHAMALTAAL